MQQEALKEFTSSALMQQIDQLLLVQKAKDLNINVDAEITREMADDPQRTQRCVADQKHCDAPARACRQAHAPVTAR